MNVPKQWRLRAETPAGEPVYVTVTVSEDGRIGVHASGAVSLTPLQASRLRELLADAMAETLRGERW